MLVFLKSSLWLIENEEDLVPLISRIHKKKKKKSNIIKSYKLEISAFQAALYSVLEQQNYFILPKVGFLQFIGQHSHVLCSTKYKSMH